MSVTPPNEFTYRTEYRGDVNYRNAFSGIETKGQATGYLFSSDGQGTVGLRDCGPAGPGGSTFNADPCGFDDSVILQVFWSSTAYINKCQHPEVTFTKTVVRG